MRFSIERPSVFHWIFTTVSCREAQRQQLWRSSAGGQHSTPVVDQTGSRPPKRVLKSLFSFCSLHSEACRAREPEAHTHGSEHPQTTRGTDWIFGLALPSAPFYCRFSRLANYLVTQPGFRSRAPAPKRTGGTHSLPSPRPAAAATHPARAPPLVALLLLPFFSIPITALLRTARTSRK